MKGMVQRVRIIGTDVLVFSAWIRTEFPGESSTLTTFNGEWHGKIGHDMKLERYAHLPAYSKERSAAFNAARDERNALAHAMIIAAYPEAASGIREGCEIVMRDADEMLDAPVMREVALCIRVDE